MVRVKTAFTMLMMVSLLGIAACGDDDGDENAGETATGAKSGSEPILIKTRVAAPNARDETTGEVLSGSTLGDTAFCTGGRFLDGPVRPSDRSVRRTFRCPDGTLTITFTSTPPDVRQRSDWQVVKGLAGFAGVGGGGRMSATESANGEARETFTGTVTR